MTCHTSCNPNTWAEKERRGSLHSNKASAMAAWTSGDLRKVKLQSFTSSRGSQAHYVEGEHMSVEDILIILDRHNKQLNASGERMLETIVNMEPHDFQLIQQEFPVSYLQHVTDKDSMETIYKQGGFRIMQQSSRPGFSDLSFWSAGVASKHIEEACERSYEDVKGVLEPNVARRYEERIKEQFANSPAFDASASRYGNFKFSFPLFYLLDLYQAQHCGGEEPQLRILGTDMYKLEIAHYILVHSPDENDQFGHLPVVPTVRGASEFLPFVYWKQGKLYWGPESTSSVLTVKFSEEGIAPRECQMQCDFFDENNYCIHIRDENYAVPSVWNHLVFAFHLPTNLRLMVPKDQLLKNLAACSIDEPALLDESNCWEIEDAEAIIRQMKRITRKRMRPY